MPHLSKEKAYGVFACVLVAYTVQCELASYLNRRGYSKPFFLLYLTHSSYSFIGVLHYIGLKYTLRRNNEDTTILPHLQEVQDAIKEQLLGPNTRSRPFPWDLALRRLLALTVLIALPAGIWYSSISLTSMTSLTALYNLNAFWAYILSIYYSRSERWELRSGLAVTVACLGVLVMTYGDSKEADASAAAIASSPADLSTTAASMADGILKRRSTVGGGQSDHPLIGDLLGLLSSFACGFYEVWYKRYIALPQDAAIPLEASHTTYTHLEGAGEAEDSNANRHESLDGRPAAKGLDAELDEIEASLSPQAQSDLSPSALEKNDTQQERGQGGESNPALFLLHANTITASIGIATFLLFWIPIPILHWLGWEEFALPPDGLAVLAIMGVCLGGVFFNAGFMILLSLWGPVVTSVGNLFTLILVAISDQVIALVNGYSTLSLSTLTGSGFILAAFGVLVTGPSEGAGHP